MELLQLRYLCTAARYENFSRAARHHNIPQSAISKTIAQLERELGVALFVRKGNRVKLSEAGELFCRQVQDALDRLTAAAAAVRESTEPLQGELRVAAEEYEDAVDALLSSFCAGRPELTVRTGRPRTGLRDWDLCVCAQGRTEPDFPHAAQPLRAAETFLLLPATHRLADWERVPAEELEGERWVCLLERSPAEAVAQARLEEAGVVLREHFLCEDTAALIRHVGNGAGIAFSASAGESAASAGVVRRRLEGTPLLYPLLLYARRPLPPVAAAFASVLQARLGRPAEKTRQD